MDFTAAFFSGDGGTHGISSEGGRHAVRSGRVLPADLFAPLFTFEHWVFLWNFPLSAKPGFISSDIAAVTGCRRLCVCPVLFQIPSGDAFDRSGAV